MGAVHDHFDAARTPEFADPLDREDLPGQVGDVANQNHLRLRGDAFHEAVVEIVHRGRRHRERELLQHDPVAPLALLPRGDHAGIILVRGQHLVARLEVEAHDADLQRFAGVPRDRHFFGIAAELAGQIASHPFNPRLELLPHVPDRRLIRLIEIALQRLMHHPRRRTHPAVVQIDHRPIKGKGAPDLAPVVLVRGHVGRAGIACGRAGRFDHVNGAVLESQGRGRGRTHSR